MNRIVCSLLIMIVITNLLRIIPVTILRRRITNVFFRSFLYYVPYVTLAVMTVPAILNVTSNPLIGAISLMAGIIAAWCRLSLFYVSAICCLTVLFMEMIM